MDEIHVKYISIEEILQTIKNKWKLIVIIPLITTIVSIIYSFYIVKPEYQAYTKVFIGKETVQQEKYSDSDVEMYQKLLKTYSELIKTNTLVTKALKQNNINLQSAAVLNTLTTVPMTNTQILEITYKNSDALLAKDVVCAINDEFVKEARELVPNCTIKVIEDVSLPDKPINLNKKLNIVIGFILGFMISLGIIFLLEFLDNTFKSKEKLERILELPALGLIPDNTKIRNIKDHNTLIVEKKPRSIMAEGYRSLMANINYSSSEKQIQTLLITSAKLQEGKSTVASNLALSFAEHEKTVIIIDCDLRRPSLHKKFNIPNTCGLSDIIIKDDSLENAIQKYNENLHILSSGTFTGKPVSMLSSQAMDDLLITLKEKYDVIILDSAPIEAVVDAQILSTKVDGTLIVVHAGVTNVSSTLETKNLLNKVNGTVIGTVLHRAESNKNNYYYNHSHNCSIEKNLLEF